MNTSQLAYLIQLANCDVLTSKLKLKCKLIKLGQTDICINNTYQTFAGVIYWFISIIDIFFGDGNSRLVISSMKTKTAFYLF
jgi:hypothetical protein